MIFGYGGFLPHFVQLMFHYRSTIHYPQFWDPKSAENRKFWPKPLTMHMWGVSCFWALLPITRATAVRWNFCFFWDCV